MDPSVISLEYLERKSPCESFDNDIRFYDFYTDPHTSKIREHVYLVSNNTSTKESERADIYDFSVTTFVHSFFPHFDADAIIANMIKGKKWKSDPSYMYYRKDPEDIKRMWNANGKEATTLGTSMHAHIEKFYNHATLWTLKTHAELHRELPKYFAPDEILLPEIQQFINFHIDGPAQWKWIPWRTELRVFDRDIHVAGSVDMLYKSPNYTENNRLLIMLDWKRSKEIIKHNNYGKTANHPIQHLPDSNFYQYSLQLNVYKRIIEKNTSYKIEYMALGVFHPNFQSYQVHPVIDMTRDIDKIWEARLAHARK